MWTRYGVRSSLERRDTSVKAERGLVRIGKEEVEYFAQNHRIEPMCRGERRRRDGARRLFEERKYLRISSYGIHKDRVEPARSKS